jgi:hypothetical protein
MMPGEGKVRGSGRMGKGERMEEEKGREGRERRRGQ